MGHHSHSNSANHCLSTDVSLSLHHDVLFMTNTRYRPAWWVPGAHAQTLWGKFMRPHQPIATHVERIETPDGDFLDIHSIEPAPSSSATSALASSNTRTPAPANSECTTPHIILLHGLEGGMHSHYARGLLLEMQRRGWGASLVLWRSCGEEPNRAPRFYHSGETTDLAHVIEHIIDERPRTPLGVVGVSLGGNILLKYLGERGTSVPGQIAGAAAVSVPFDLARGSSYISRGFSRVYERYFMDTLKPKAREKAARYPGLIDVERIDQIATLQQFDDALTAPLHGFADAADYYAQSSSIRYLDRIGTETLLLNAVDDPFLPPDVLDEVRRIAAPNPHLHVDFPNRGGHAGFVGGWNPFRPVYYLEKRVGDFLATQFDT